MLRRLILSLLMLWLPLQGFAAQTMPFCRHELARLGGVAGAAHTALAGAPSFRHHTPLAYGSRPRSTGNHDKLFPCDNCGSCRLACAAVLPTEPGSFVVQAVSAAPDLLTPLAPPSVVLELPHPPPLPSC